MNSRFTLIGITDEVTTCDCCGKSDLKCTMLLQEYDADGNQSGEVYFGRDCGARALGWKVSADRAEKLVRGTARVSWDVLFSAWSKSHCGAPTAPARVVVDGVALEVWDRFYGKLPAGRDWTRVAKDMHFYWRAAA